MGLICIRALRKIAAISAMNNFAAAVNKSSGRPTPPTTSPQPGNTNPKTTTSNASGGAEKPAASNATATQSTDIRSHLTPGLTSQATKTYTPPPTATPATQNKQQAGPTNKPSAQFEALKSYITQNNIQDINQLGDRAVATDNGDPNNKDAWGLYDSYHNDLTKEQRAELRKIMMANRPSRGTNKTRGYIGGENKYDKATYDLDPQIQSQQLQSSVSADIENEMNDPAEAAYSDGSYTQNQIKAAIPSGFARQPNNSTTQSAQAPVQYSPSATKGFTALGGYGNAQEGFTNPGVKYLADNSDNPYYNPKLDLYNEGNYEQPKSTPSWLWNLKHGNVGKFFSGLFSPYKGQIEHATTGTVDSFYRNRPMRSWSIFGGSQQPWIDETDPNLRRK